MTAINILIASEFRRDKMRGCHIRRWRTSDDNCREY